MGLGFYVHLNRVETKTISQSGSSAAIAVAGCSAVGAPINILYQAGLAENSSPKKCLFMRASGFGSTIIIYPGTYRDSRCK